MIIVLDNIFLKSYKNRLSLSSGIGNVANARRRGFEYVEAHYFPI